MTDVNRDPGDDATGEVCVIDPGGEGRGNVPMTDVDTRLRTTLTRPIA